jgi:hypothetical protein
VQSAVATFDPMANAYQSPDGSEIQIQLNKENTMQLVLDLENQKISSILIEKVTISGQTSLNEVFDLNTNAKFELTTMNGKVKARTAFLSDDDSIILKSLFSKNTLKPQGTMYLDDPGLFNPNRVSPCASAYAAMLSANRALGSAYQNFNGAWVAYWGSTTVSGTGGFLLGGPIGAAWGWAGAAIGTAPGVAVTYNQWQEAKNDWQSAALDVRSC